MNLKRAAFLPLIILLCCSFASAPQSKVGNKAPDFELPAYGTSQPVKLSEINQDTPVLLVFWATWCPNCREEIPALNNLQESAASKGYKIISINVEEPQEDVEKFIKEQGLKYPVAFDLDGTTANEYGLVGIPVVIYVEKGGEVLYYGYRLPQNIDSLLEKKETLKT